MTSKQSDLADRAAREKLTDAALADDRRGRDRLRRLADAEQAPSHPKDGLPNTSGGRQ